MNHRMAGHYCPPHVPPPLPRKGILMLPPPPPPMSSIPKTGPAERIPNKASTWSYKPGFGNPSNLVPMGMGPPTQHPGMSCPQTLDLLIFYGMHGSIKF